MNRQEQNLQEFSADDLADLFTQHKINCGKSMDIIRKKGGIKTLYLQLKVDPEFGINTNANQIQSRRQKYGNNRPIIATKPSIFQFISKEFINSIFKIFCLIVIGSLILRKLTGISEEWLEGILNLIAIIIMTVISVHKYIKSLRNRKQNQRKYVKVLRNRIIVNISVDDLLVGDIVKIQTGQIISVDGLLIQGNGVVCDQSSINRQSISIKKKPAFTYEQTVNPFLISGSTIIQGTGEMIVLAVGIKTQYNQRKQNPEMVSQTLLTQKSKILLQKIRSLSIYIGSGTFAILLLHLVYDITISQNRWSFWTFSTINLFVKYFIVTLNIVVITVPHSIPLVITIAIAYNVKKMLEQSNLVRHLDVCETLGGVNNICTDKTGILTKDSMEVVSLFYDNEIQQNVNNSNLGKEFKQRFSMNACLNLKIRQFQQINDKTELSLLQLAFKYGYDFRQVRNDKSIKILKLFPFSSSIKKKGVIYEKNGKITLLIRGAPDFVLGDCKSYLLGSKQVKIDDNFKNKLNQAIQNFSSRGLRNLLIAQTQLQSYNFEEDDTLIKYCQQLTFITLVGIKDPLRPETISAVQQFKQAGITVRMLTGDNKVSAVAVAKQAGILRKEWKQTDKKNYEVMEGREFRQFVGGLLQQENVEKIANLDNFKLVRDQLRVLARSTPQDKYIMVAGLKQLKDVVAMTGDGTNDAPSLRKADVGFAMGISGTQVARQSAGIILLDDNFKSILKAVKYGRNLFQSIRKFLQFQLTVNIAALVLVLLGNIILKQSPLNNIQILWINLIIDTLAAFSFVTQPPTDQLLKRNPQGKYLSLVTPVMWKNIIFHVIFQVGILSFVLFYQPIYFNLPSSIGLDHHDLDQRKLKQYAIFFNVFILLQIFNQINSRKLKNSELNVFSGFSRLSVVIVVSNFVIQYVLLLLGGRSMGVTRLTFEQHLYCYFLGALSLPFGILIKLFGPKELFIFNDIPKEIIQQQKRD